MQSGFLVKRYTFLTWLGLAVAFGNRLEATEVFVLNFRSFSHTSEAACILWKSDILFHNMTSQDARIRLLGISNGPPPAVPDELVVPAGKTVSAQTKVNWEPTSESTVPLWVARIDVPEGVVVQSRAEAYFQLCDGGFPPDKPDLGAFSLPVVRTLDPPNGRRIHLGADLGGENSYVNVGIYNASNDSANATVELRQACDDSVVVRRSVTIPGNSVIQLGGMDGSSSGCGFPANTFPWVRYVTVTVDRPSFSYVVNKMYDLPLSPKIPYASPFSY